MAIKVQDLEYTYAAGLPGETKALDGVSFDVADGTICGIIGHTGSGKSTLLQTLDGLIKPSAGSIMIDGVEVTDPKTKLVDVRRKVGIVFQYPEYQLFEETVAKDVAFGPKNLGLKGEELEIAVRESLELVGLDYEKVKDKSPFELSGGQKRRVAIAGVIAMNPSILILDEPTAGLDPKAHKEILSMVKRIHDERNITILFVSHNMGDVADMCSQVLVLHEGHIMLDGTPRYVFGHRKHLDSVDLGLPPITEIMDKIAGEVPEFNELFLDWDEAADKLADYIKNKNAN